MDKVDHQETSYYAKKFITVFFSILFIFLHSEKAISQAATTLKPATSPPTAPAAAAPTAVEGEETAQKDEEEEKPEIIEELEEGGGQPIKLLRGFPNQRRIKRHLNLVAGIKHDEEFLIPNVPLNLKGAPELVDVQRIKGTDMFRILPIKDGSGIVTIHNKKTGQILVELRLDIRKQDIEKTLREVKAMLADIDGIEFKIVNDIIILDGFVLLPKDLVRLGNVLRQTGLDQRVKNLVSLSPIARKKIVEYIAREINNPEVTVTAVGDFIKLEGVVNNDEEEKRILQIVNMHMPDIVSEKTQDLGNFTILSRKVGSADGLIINLLTKRPPEDKVEPPPKMIQVVVHFVEFSDRYMKKFNFIFSPSLTGIGQAASAPRAPTSIGEIASIVNNLLPKINWARTHGYIRVLDTASVLTQNTVSASIKRTFKINNNGQATASPGGQQGASQENNASLDVSVRPVIKSERTGLIELGLNVTTSPLSGTSLSSSTTVNTLISVRDRASAAFGGIISKKSINDYGGPSDTQNAVITLNHGKTYEKGASNFVVFVTPVIKSSASAGVEQVKKKFRMKDAN